MVKNKFKIGDTVECIKIPTKEDFEGCSASFIYSENLILGGLYEITKLGKRNSISLKNLHYYPAHCFTNILTETTMELW